MTLIYNFNLNQRSDEADVLTCNLLIILSSTNFLSNCNRKLTKCKVENKVTNLLYQLISIVSSQEKFNLLLSQLYLISFIFLNFQNCPHKKLKGWVGFGDFILNI